MLTASTVQDLVDILQVRAWVHSHSCSRCSAQCLTRSRQANPSRLVLVDFYAPWCNACKSLFPKLCQLCVQNPHVVAVKLNWEENKPMAKTLGVKVRRE